MMRSSYLTAILSLILCFTSTKQQHQMKRYIFLKLTDGPMQEGDEVVLGGRFINRVAQLRFISRSTSCTGGILPGRRGPPQCQPLVLMFKPRLKRVEAFYKGKTGDHRDVFLNSAGHDHISSGQAYRLLIKVGRENYTVLLNGERLLTVVDKIGHEEITQIRSYGGNFTEYYVVYNNRPETNIINVLSAGSMCGTRPGLIDAAPRIIGGSNAKGGEFPWQAAIRRKTVLPWANYKHICGASLIKSCWVVTAGHCVEELLGGTKNFLVRVGDYHNGEGGTYSAQEDQQDLEIESVIRHPLYATRPSPTNDIALIHLRTTASNMCAKTSDFVRPICLPDRNEQYPTDTFCSITGWGAMNWTQNPEHFPQVLQKADVRIHDHAICRNSYGRHKDGSYRVASSTVCAADRGVDSCVGDSGGPLSCKRSGGRSGTKFVLWGVTSWGAGCATAQRPGIYTKIVDYLNWIYTTTA